MISVLLSVLYYLNKMSSKPSYQLKEITQWEWSEVQEWLTDNNFPNVISKLEPHLITGYDLFYLTVDQMRAFDITGFNEINRLNRVIHLKVLEYCMYYLIIYINPFTFIVRISFTYENVSYSYQLDFEPNLTVESMANTIKLSLEIKDQLFISTYDNKVLFPYIKIIELLLIEPDRYRNLKVFNAKEALPANNNYSINPNANLSSNPLKQNSTIPIGNTQYSLPIGSANVNPMPLSTMPIMPSALSLKYKSNFEEFRSEKQEIESNIGKFKDKKNDEIVPLNNDNTDIGIKPELSFKNKYESELKPSPYMQYKMNQKQQTQTQPNSIIDDSKLNSTNFYNKKLASNQMNSFSNTNLMQQQPKEMMPNSNNSNTKDVKDSMDLNNPATNYIFNSGELLTYDQLKKTQKNPIPTSSPSPYSSIPQSSSNMKEEMMGFNKDSYQKYKSNPSLNIATNSNALNSEIPQVSKEKEEYRRFSSEKRNFRTYGNISNVPQEEEYQAKAYEKFNNVPIEDFNDKFNNEKFNRFSSRQPQSLTQGSNLNLNQNQNQIQPQKQSDLNNNLSYNSHQLNYDMKSKKLQSNSNTNRNNQFENFNLERKPYHHQIPIQTTSDENDHIMDDNNQIPQDRVN